jgi:hypothetical protein
MPGPISVERMRTGANVLVTENTWTEAQPSLKADSAETSSELIMNETSDTPINSLQ